jgi:hypothetical protein
MAAPRPTPEGVGRIYCIVPDFPPDGNTLHDVTATQRTIGQGRTWTIVPVPLKAATVAASTFVSMTAERSRTA